MGRLLRSSPREGDWPAVRIRRGLGENLECDVVGAWGALSPDMTFDEGMSEESASEGSAS